MKKILIVEGNLKEENENFKDAGILTHTESLKDSLSYFTNKLEADALVSHVGDANTGLQFASDTVIIEGNDVAIGTFATNRIELAKERLNVLSNCNCEEYNELKEIIEGTKKSKY